LHDLQSGVCVSLVASHVFLSGVHFFLHGCCVLSSNPVGHVCKSNPTSDTSCVLPMQHDR
jgi:hypothetical protein